MAVATFCTPFIEVTLTGKFATCQLPAASSLLPQRLPLTYKRIIALVWPLLVYAAVTVARGGLTEPALATSASCVAEALHEASNQIKITTTGTTEFQRTGHRLFSSAGIGRGRTRSPLCRTEISLMCTSPDGQLRRRNALFARLK